MKWTVCEPLLNTAHTLIAGTTGSGKSVLLNDCIVSLIDMERYMYMIDLKRVELGMYRRSDYCVGYTTEPGDVCPMLDNVLYIMETRYKNMETHGLRKYARFDIYVVIDELADLASHPGVLERLIRIGRLGRASGIHLLCATQAPSRKVIPADLMLNFTCCVALRCRSTIESRQILGIADAEKLPLHGKGYRWDDKGIEMIDIPYTSDEDIMLAIKV